MSALDDLIALYKDAVPLLDHEGYFEDEPGSYAKAMTVIEAAQAEAQSQMPPLKTAQRWQSLVSVSEDGLVCWEPWPDVAYYRVSLDGGNTWRITEEPQIDGAVSGRTITFQLQGFAWQGKSGFANVVDVSQ